MRREFCCSECGLIWFDKENIPRADNCPECDTSQGIYACDTFGYAYASEGIVNRLREYGKIIHYAKDHPYYGKK